jgi:hypothetical protein
MSLFFRYFDGEPLFNNRARSHSRFEDSDWHIGQFDDLTYTADLCELMDGAEAAVHRSRTSKKIFETAPGVEELERIFSQAINACADDGILAIIEVHYRDLRRAWMHAAADEGVAVACPSRNAFRAAVERELRRRHSWADEIPDADSEILPIPGK